MNKRHPQPVLELDGYSELHSEGWCGHDFYDYVHETELAAITGDKQTMEYFIFEVES